MKRLGHKNWYQYLTGGVLAAALGIVGLLSLFGVAIYFVVTPDGEEIEPVSLCPKSGPIAHTLIIFDRTDPLTPSQVRGALTYVDQVKSEAAEGEKLSIHEVDPGKMNGLSDPIFSMCKPREGSDVDPWTGSPHMVQLEFEKKFGKPLEEALQDKLEGGGASHSPIIESIIDAVTLPNFGRDQKHRRLILFSDLLQYGKHLSFYSGSPDFEKWSSSPLGQNLIADLSGVDVEIYLLVRADEPASKLQGNKLVHFWSLYFNQSGVNKLTFKKLR